MYIYLLCLIFVYVKDMILKESDLSGIDIVDNEMENINDIRKKIIEKADILIEKSFQSQVNILYLYKIS